MCGNQACSLVAKNMVHWSKASERSQWDHLFQSVSQSVSQSVITNATWLPSHLTGVSQPCGSELTAFKCSSSVPLRCRSM